MREVRPPTNTLPVRRSGAASSAGNTLILLGTVIIILTLFPIPVLPFLAAFIFVGGMLQLAAGRSTRLFGVFTDGVLALVTGTAIAVQLLQNMQFLTLLIGGYLIAVGIPAIVAWLLSGTRQTLWLLLAGMVAVALGLLLLTGAVPGTEAVYGRLIGVRMITVGIADRNIRNNLSNLSS